MAYGILWSSKFVDYNTKRTFPPFLLIIRVVRCHSYGNSLDAESNGVVNFGPNNMHIFFLEKNRHFVRFVYVNKKNRLSWKRLFSEPFDSNFVTRRIFVGRFKFFFRGRSRVTACTRGCGGVVLRNVFAITSARRDKCRRTAFITHWHNDLSISATVPRLHYYYYYGKHQTGIYRTPDAPPCVSLPAEERDSRIYMIIVRLSFTYAHVTPSSQVEETNSEEKKNRKNAGKTFFLHR